MVTLYALTLSFTQQVKAGQVEEMIEAAKDELVLIEKLQQSKPWDTSKPAKVDPSIL